MDVEEYVRHDGLGLAELVASGEVTAGELLDAARSRAKAVNPAINAIVVTSARNCPTSSTLTGLSTTASFRSVAKTSGSGSAFSA